MTETQIRAFYRAVESNDSFALFDRCATVGRITIEGTPMSIMLDHTHIPVRDKVASARLYSEIFDREFKQPADWCTAIRINDSLKFGFVDYIEPRESHHYAFLVDDAEFDAILARVQKAGVAYGSDPDKTTNGELNSYNGGRGFYFLDFDGHLIELLTSPDPSV